MPPGSPPADGEVIAGRHPELHLRCWEVPEQERLVLVLQFTTRIFPFGVAVEEFLLRVEILSWDSDAAKSYRDPRKYGTDRPAYG
jgi:hypothetical protein